MEPKDAARWAREISDHARERTGCALIAEAMELVRINGGERNSFYLALSKVGADFADDFIWSAVSGIMESFADSIEAGRIEGISLQRQAEIDVVSDFLGQADGMLGTKGVHPATPATLIGAALEEFLRNWVEEAGLTLGTRKPGIDSYASLLRSAELITKQDMKDVTAWGGVRNHAAHGEWDEVSDPKRVGLMLEGVNLFMRKYGSA